VKHVVITGGTRGIGLGLAKSFVDLGCRVTVCGRSEGSVRRALDGLDDDRVAGQACDVGQVAQVAALWDFAAARAPVDVWINNAGIDGPHKPIHELQGDEVEALVATNVLGVFHGSSVAARGLLAQPGGGWLWNMEGLGSDGRMVDGLTPYGTTKAALRYLTRGLVRELKGTPVRVGFLSPGMVLTELLIGEARTSPDWERMTRVFDILADRVETVTPWLARRVLAAERHGARVAWLTGPKIAGRFLTAPLRRRGVVAGYLEELEAGGLEG
jgi:NAD(P)-dependent dehydrogenase (short-subunit alcohol dehydrogenase family)